MNYVKQVAEMLGVKIGEEFYIKDCAGNTLLDPYCFKDDGLYLLSSAKISAPYMFRGLINGDYKIKKVKWVPKFGECFFYIAFGADNAIRQALYSGSTEDASLYVSGNCFKTKEEAEAGAADIVRKWNGVLKSE